MAAPVFTTNDSEISRLEGLYIKERNPPAQISGAFLGVVAIVGETVKGPVDKAIEISAEGRFQEVFGGRDAGNGGAITNKVWLTMLNKFFGKVVVVRAAAAGATKSTKTFADVTPTNIIRVDASSVGVWSAGATLEILNASDADVNHFDLKFSLNGRVWHYKNLNVSGSNDNTLTVLGSDIDANPITITKLANGRPLNSAAAAFTTLGTEGSIADTDFTASNRGLNKVASYPGVGVVLTAERESNTLKTYMKTLAAAASDRLFLIGADSETTTSATAITDVANFRDQRLVYCFNHAYTLDPETGQEVITAPKGWMASILSQIDVDIHPGEEDTKRFTAGISRLYKDDYARGDYISLREAGISAFEKDDGYAFMSGVVTDLTSNKTEITRRRMADFIQLSLAKTLKFAVKKKNTESRRIAIAGMITAFLKDLQKAERVVATDDDVSGKGFLVDTEKLNTAAQRAAGIEKILLRVRLISHMLHLVLETEIGTSVTISEVA